MKQVTINKLCRIYASNTQWDIESNPQYGIDSYSEIITMNLAVILVLVCNGETRAII